MKYLAVVCMHERNLDKLKPLNAEEVFYKKGAGRQFIIFSIEDASNTWAKKFARDLTRNGCHVSVEDSEVFAKAKLDKALKFHRLDDEETRPLFSDTLPSI